MFLNYSPLFSIFSLVAILVGSRDHRTQFWKGAIQGSFHHSLVANGPVVSEKIFFLISSPLFSNLHNRSKSAKVQFIKNPEIYVKKLIIMLIQFKFGHFLA